MSDRLVTAATFNHPIAAALAKNYLESEGIPALLLDESAVATDWLLSNAIGGIKLQVSLQHLERAEQLLESLPGTDDEEDEEETPTTKAAIASPATAQVIRAKKEELAEELRSEQIDQTPCNQLADRLLRTTVFGLIFWPLQLYALVLLFSAISMREEISPERRWKIWLSLCVSLLFLGAFLFCSPYFCLYQRLPGL